MLVLNVRPETIKLLEENIGNMVFESVVVILFFRSVFFRSHFTQKIELSYDPAIALLGIYLKEIKTRIQKNICTPMITAALFAIAQKWKQTKCPSVDK